MLYQFFIFILLASTLKSKENVFYCKGRCSCRKIDEDCTDLCHCKGNCQWTMVERKKTVLESTEERRGGGWERQGGWGGKEQWNGKWGWFVDWCVAWNLTSFCVIGFVNSFVHQYSALFLWPKNGQKWSKYYHLLVMVIISLCNSCFARLLVVKRNPYLNPILLSKFQPFLQKLPKTAKIVPVFGKRLNFWIKVMCYASIGFRMKFIAHIDLALKNSPIFAKKPKNS